MNNEILSAAGVALLQVICSCFRVMQSWQWGTCWETLHVVDSNRLAHWRWSRRTSWMMGHQSGCGFRLMRTRWRRGERCKCKEIELTRRAGKFLEEQWKCNEIWKPLSRQGSAVFDFTGTGTEVWGNCNAPRAITLSALIYCLRCMVGQDIPLNQVE